MSLLRKPGRESILVFPTIVTQDEDNNDVLVAQEVGIPKKAVIQNAAQSGTSARRAEQDNEGYETEQNYRLRFSPMSTHIELGLAGEIEWNGERWHVVGFESVYNGSNKTKHKDYMIRRN